MKTIKAVLVDDERHSLKLLQQKIERNCPEVEVHGAYSDPRAAIEALRQQSPDVLFLDIEMPYFSGFDLLRELGDIDFEVIFTTAYDEFAIEAIRVSALDYLMKPIVVEELKQAVSRLRNRDQQQSGDFHQLLRIVQQQSAGSTKVPIPTLDGIELLEPDNILYCESKGNYCNIHFLEDSPLLTSKTLKEVESLLPAATFLRIHQSYLVNFQYVRKYLKTGGGYVMLKSGKELKVSKARREQVMEAIYNQHRTKA